LVAGPLVTWIVGAGVEAAVMGGLSALGAGLYSLGIPKDSIVRYEAAIKNGSFVLVAHGTPDDVARAHEIVGRTGPAMAEQHQP
jgi:hypothetical protein